MTTIKKKDLKKYKPSSKKIKKSKKEDIEELVGTDGAPISGNRNPTNNSEIETAPQGTSDDHASIAIQPRRYYGGVGGTAYSHGSVHAEGEEIEEVEEIGDIDEIAESKMKDMIENLIGDKNDNNGMVKTHRDSDVNRNEIPDLEELATTHQKPIVAKKAQEILKTIEMNHLNGEEVGIVINYLLQNIDISQIPQDYKNLLRKNL
jgi:hypothetical protein